jgi:hypothetical protein
MNLLSLRLVRVNSTLRELAFLEGPHSIPEMNLKESDSLRGFGPLVRMRDMKRSRWVILLTTLAILTIGGWLWWVKPHQVDMAIYAPAASLLYLESNRP